MGKEEYSMFSSLGNTNTYYKSPHNSMGYVSLSSLFSHIHITLFNNQSCIHHHQLLLNALNFSNCISLRSLKKRRSRQAKPWRLQRQLVSRYLITLCCGSYLWVEIIVQRSLWKTLLHLNAQSGISLFFYCSISEAQGILIPRTVVGEHAIIVVKVVIQLRTVPLLSGRSRALFVGVWNTMPSSAKRFVDWRK